MLVMPAIDLKDGKAVRLYKGDYDNKTVYSNSPEKVAKEFQNLGAKYIHIVDLDGARNKDKQEWENEKTNININVKNNIETIKRIRESVSIQIEVGGGIRNKEKVRMYLEELKVDRVVLGTAAINDFEFLKEMIEEYGEEKIVISVDVKDGYVMTSGWEENSKVYYIDFIKKLETAGVKYIEVTDISKDGTLEGPNFEMYKKIKEETKINFVVSGGIKNEDNIKKIKELDYYGCIVGKAYYEGKIDLKEVLL